MLQLVASNRGSAYYPMAAGREVQSMALAGLRIKDQPLNKTMYLAIRPEHIALE